MRTAKSAAIALICAISSFATAKAGERLGIGTIATPQEIAGWNIDIRPDGTNLPAGSGTVTQGREIYAEKCAMCHGEKGEGGLCDQLVGGMGTLNTPHPIKTIGSYWPYSTTLFDYIRRAMPLPAPQSLTNDEVYALSAYLLSMNGIIPEDSTLNAEELKKIKMPNRDNFISDQRPDTHNDRCMKDCAVTSPVK